MSGIANERIHDHERADQQKFCDSPHLSPQGRCRDARPAMARCAVLRRGQQLHAYELHVLVSDGSVRADFTDPHLKNPWGIAFNPFGFDWVANNHTGTSTLYDGLGQASPWS